MMETDLTPQQKQQPLRTINLIKEKRCGKIKSRNVAYGSVKRNVYSKDETTSLTVSTDALMMSLLIDIWEKRDFISVDVGRVYLYAKMHNFIVLKLKGEAVNIICRVSSVYDKFVCWERGKKVLYLQLLKALYGCVKLVLLYYKLFSTTLLDLGFKLNPYDE